jgi:hypothetical protein
MTWRSVKELEETIYRQSPGNAFKETERLRTLRSKLT